MTPTLSITPRRTLAKLSAACLTYAMLAASAAIVLTPFAYLLASSLKTGEDFFGSLFLPAGEGVFGVAWGRITSANYTRLISEFDFTNNIVNSVFLASTTSILATLGAAMGGYALAMIRFPGRRFVTNLVLFALIIPAALMLAPSYQLLYFLGLLDTYTGLILPAAAPAFGVFLFRQAFLSSLPPQLLEAGRIDGCGELRLFVSIGLPLVRPMIGAFVLITYLGTWNNFIWPQIVLQSPEKLPLSVAIAQLRGVYSQDYGLLMAGTVISIAPVLVLFLLLQREFIAGLTAGAVKG